MTEAVISLAIIVGLVAAAVMAVGAYFVWTALAPGGKTRIERQIIGEIGVVIETLAPDGIVRLHEENWTARVSSGEPIQVGTRVKVLSMEGTVLTVAPTEAA